MLSLNYAETHRYTTRLCSVSSPLVPVPRQARELAHAVYDTFLYTVTATINYLCRGRALLPIVRRAVELIVSSPPTVIRFPPSAYVALIADEHDASDPTSLLWLILVSRSSIVLHLILRTSVACCLFIEGKMTKQTVNNKLSRTRTYSYYTSPEVAVSGVWIYFPYFYPYTSILPP